jgi:hypothetical protein
MLIHCKAQRAQSIFRLSLKNSFKDAQVGTCWHHFVELEIGLAQEAPVLFLRSFLIPMKSGEHNVVRKLSQVEFVPCRYDRLDKLRVTRISIAALCILPDDIIADGVMDQFGQRVDPQLIHDGGAMRLDRPYADVE